MAPRLKVLAGIALGALGCAHALHAEEKKGFRELMTDPEDGRFDTSSWLLDRRGFLPVPIIITEPAVGYGGGFALAFFHRAATPPPAGEKPPPPSISGIALAATENGTKIAGAGHLGIWRQDRIRSVTAIGVPSINIAFHGGGQFPALDQGIEYNLEGWAAYENLTFRLGGSSWWAGMQLIYLDAKTKLKDPPPQPVFDDLDASIRNTGVGGVIEHDSRDNIFSPTTGWDGTLRARYHWGEFGVDFDYVEVDLDSKYYFRAGERWFLGWRVKGSFTGEDTPFYALPSISMRGIPAMRYQGEEVAATEFEARYALDGRWSVLGFSGVGRAASGSTDLGDAADRWAGGAGFRYLIARKLGMQVGIDVAKGPEEWAFYLQVGSGWNL